MTRRCAVSIAFTLLLGGCGDSATPQAPATSTTPASLAATEYNKGIDFSEREDWDAAIACYSEAIRLKPDFADAYNNRGNAYDDKGEYDLAIKDYSAAIRLKPDDPASHPVTPADIVATIYRCLGINPDTPVYEPNGRPVPARHGGQPIEELLA